MFMFDPPPPVFATPTPLPLSAYSTQYFTDPFTLQHMFDLPLNFGGVFALAGRTTATILQIASPNIIWYYIGVRIGMLAFLWLVGFVMQKIGKPLPDSPGVIVIREGIEGLATKSLGFRLPKLGPSGLPPIGGRRRRRGTWP